jgi:membrane-associated phospholipid phosphatase
MPALKDDAPVSLATVAETPEADVRVSQAAPGLRVAEEIVLAFLVYATVACFELLTSAREQVTIAALNVLAGTVIFLLGRVTEENPRTFLVAVRNGLPAVLILLAYRESGFLFIPDPTHRLDHVFVRWDSVLLHNQWVLATLTASAPWLQYYLELVYLLCYPIVPLGLGCLLLAKRKIEIGNWKLESAGVPSKPVQSKIQSPKSKIVVDRFWTAVLIATLFCYTVYPFFPLTPPRLLSHDLPGPAAPPLLRTANLWLLGHYGVQACIFPSGHVAAVTATALAVRAYRPRLGTLFVVLAASVAVATVFLRYHYAADALAGALAGWAAFRTSEIIHHHQIGSRPGPTFD